MLRQGFRCDEPGRCSREAQMGGVWRSPRLGPMRLGWSKWTQAKGQPRPR